MRVSPLVSVSIALGLGILVSVMQTEVAVSAMDKEPERVSFYVATNGSDAWSGTLEAPNSQRTDGPLATLKRARDVVRELKSRNGGLAKPITVLVRGGRYYLGETLVLTQRDSGAAGMPVTYAAYPGERPIISGGRRLTGWKSYKGSILRCAVPEAKGGKWRFRQLFVNGTRQVRARFPNLNPADARWNGRWALSQQDDSAFEEGYLVWSEPGAFPRSWAKPTEGEVFLLPRNLRWGDSALIRIHSVDRSRNIIRLVHGGRDFDVNPFHMPNRDRVRPDSCQFIVENLLEELDQPGEWCLDGEDGVVYLWPPKGCDVRKAETVAPCVKRLISLDGVEHVSIRGLTLTETLGGEPRSAYEDAEGLGAQSPSLMSGWEYCGEAVYLHRCVDVLLEGNRIHGIGGNGICLRNRNERNMIRGNEICDAEGNGIVAAGGLYDLFGCAGGKPYPFDNRITDNHIHQTGLRDTYGAGILLGVARDNLIAHNHIHDVPHHAINLGDSRFSRHTIEYNRIERACQVTRDNGAINCWHEVPQEMEPPGHIIRYNCIADTGKGDSSATQGIYLDNWTSNCLIYGNIIVNTAPNAEISGAILIKGRNNVVENNVVIGPREGIVMIVDSPEHPPLDTVVRRNIFVRTPGPPGTPVFRIIGEDKVERFKECDHNLYFATGGIQGADTEDPVIRAEGVPLSVWRTLPVSGQGWRDRNSLVADPMFVDIAHGDYRLRPESPALKLGFLPIDMNKIGPRKEFANLDDCNKGIQ